MIYPTPSNNFVAQINYPLSKEKNVLSSELKISHISLNTFDIFSNEYFETLIQQRELLNLDFYVSAIKVEKEIYHFFEASRFLEEIYKYEAPFNPLNRKPISDFEIFVYSKEKKYFMSFLYGHWEKYQSNKDSFLPILVNDHTRTDKERGEFLDRLGYLYQMGISDMDKDESKSIYYYEKAAKLGSKRAQKALSNIYHRKNDDKKTIFWFRQFLKNNTQAKAEDFIYFACLLVESNPQEAFIFFKIAADMGNYYAIANVIEAYELGNLVKMNPDLAKEWRAKLPTEWQDKPIGDFCTHLFC